MISKYSLGLRMFSPGSWKLALAMSTITLLCGATQATAQGGKDSSIEEMRGLAQEMNSLKAVASSDPAYAAALQRYESLSAALGGDDPGHVAQGANTAQPASTGPLVVGGAPAGCNTSLATFSNATPVPIATGPTVVTSTIVVSGAGTYLFDLDLTTFITHTFPGDLDMTVTSPAGTVVTLTTDNAGTNDNVFNGTVWDDDANPAGQVPYTTNNGLVTDHAYVLNTLASPLAPEEPLAAFIGEDPNGTWTLTISDDAAGDGGSLDSWSLDIDTFTCVVPGAGISGTKTVAGNTIPGGAITYTIVLSNAGPGSQADNPGDEFVDVLPAQVTVDAVSASSGTVTEAGGTVSWNGAIAAGGSVTITIDATVGAGAFGQIDNQGTINFDSDGDGTNDASTVTDDPAVAGQADPTGFLIARTIPTLGTIGLILLALGLLAAIWHRRQYLQRR
jgi:uncharacterized repeat protein (TIGR01451 family)